MGTRDSISHPSDFFKNGEGPSEAAGGRGALRDPGTRAALGWLRVVPHGNREASVCLSFWAESLKKEEKPQTLKGPGSGTWFEWEMMI